MKKQIVFELDDGVSEKAETTHYPFLFSEKELVTFRSGQKAYIHKRDEHKKWKYV
jgi:hypothetical protein